MAETKHYVGEIGAGIIVNTGIDLSTATLRQLKVKKPDGTLVTWTATLYTVGTESTRLKYITVANDLDQSGIYYIQPYVVLPTWSGYGETDRMVISPIFG